MSAVNRIQFTVTINATAAVVRHHISSLESYEHWAQCRSRS